MRAARRAHRPLWTNRRQWPRNRRVCRRWRRGGGSIRRRPRRRTTRGVHSGLLVAAEVRRPLVVSQLPLARRRLGRRPPAHGLGHIVRRSRLVGRPAPVGGANRPGGLARPAGRLGPAARPRIRRRRPRRRAGTVLGGRRARPARLSLPALAHARCRPGPAPASTASSPARCPTARARRQVRAEAAGRRQMDRCERTPEPPLVRDRRAAVVTDRRAWMTNGLPGQFRSNRHTSADRTPPC
jgi:hypothetical protein